MFTGLQSQYLLNMFTSQIGIIMYAKYIVQSHFKSESSIPIIGDKEQYAIPVEKEVECVPTMPTDVILETENQSNYTKQCELQLSEKPSAPPPPPTIGV